MVQLFLLFSANVFKNFKIIIWTILSLKTVTLDCAGRTKELYLIKFLMHYFVLINKNFTCIKELDRSIIIGKMLGIKINIITMCVCTTLRAKFLIKLL